jgi:hypothetical protein
MATFTHRLRDYSNMDQKGGKSIVIISLSTKKLSKRAQLFTLFHGENLSTSIRNANVLKFCLTQTEHVYHMYINPFPTF